MGIMFELKTEELGRKDAFEEWHTLQCLSDDGLSKNSHKIGNECGMHVSESNLKQNFDWKTGRKESIQMACVNMRG